MAIAIGNTVRVKTILPQSYSDSEESYQRAELANVGRFLDKLGTVLSVDVEGKHPIMVQFFSNCSQCGGRVEPQAMRFSMQELSLSAQEV